MPVPVPALPADRLDPWGTSFRAAWAALANGAATPAEVAAAVAAITATSIGAATPAALTALAAATQPDLPLGTTVTSAATLVANFITPADATAAAFPLIVPAPTALNQQIVVEKVDSTANIVTLSGTFRGVATTIPLALYRETIVLEAESLTSWRPTSGHKTLSSLDARYATAAAAVFPARFISKMQTGAAVKVTLLGDSVYQGSTAGTPGTNDAFSLFCTAMTANFGVTVTKDNLGQGGRTAFWEKIQQWPTALADNADLYIIALTGKNDSPWTAGSSLPYKLGGYENLASLAQIESMIRELKATHPSADVVIASGNPYGTATTTTNQAQKAYSAGLLLLAAAYGLGYADGWNLTPRAPGYPDSADPAYLYEAAPNGVHPNTAGHAILGAALIALCPTTFTPAKAAGASLRAAEPPTTSVYPVRQSVAGVKSLTTATTTPGIDRIINPSFTGTGWNSGAGPWTSSTVGDSAYFMAKATDLFVLFTQAAGQGSVDIIADGVVVAAGVNLALMNAGAWLAVATGLAPGVHNFRIKVVTGPVTIVAMGWTAAPCEFVPITAARITAANLGVAENTNEWYGQVSNNSTATTTVSLDFVGTGVLLHARSASGGSGGFYFASVKIDGVNVAGPIWPANMAANVANVALPGCTGLPYGKHTILLTLQAAGLYIGGFSVLDEHPELRPTTCQGMAKVGETVTFPYPWTDTPNVVATSTTANPAGASTITAAGFLVTGTAGDVVRWSATGQRGVY